MRIRSVHIDGCGDSGFYSFNIRDGKLTLENCISRNAWCGFQVKAGRVTLRDCKVLDYSSHSFEVRSAGTEYRILGGEVATSVSGAGGSFVDATNGDGIIRNVIGFPTVIHVKTTEIAVDRTGTFSRSVSLPFEDVLAFKKQDVSLTPLQSTKKVQDWELGSLAVTSFTYKDVTVKGKVRKASATSGTAITIGIKIDSSGY